MNAQQEWLMYQRNATNIFLGDSTCKLVTETWNWTSNRFPPVVLPATLMNVPSLRPELFPGILPAMCLTCLRDFGGTR